MLRVEGKEGVDNIHQILYLNAFVRKEQKNQIANEVNTQMANTLFKPQLVSKQMEGKRTLQDILNATEEQEEHLKAYQKAVSHHMKHTMFKPKTGRPPKDRNTNSEDIFNYLISMGTKYSKKKEQNRKREERKYKELNPKVETHSTRMLELKKQNILEEIFEQMDGDEDGKISADSMNVDFLNKELMEFFMPMMCDMQENEIEFT